MDNFLEIHVSLDLTKEKMLTSSDAVVAVAVGGMYSKGVKSERSDAAFGESFFNSYNSSDTLRHSVLNFCNSDSFRINRDAAASNCSAASCHSSSAVS